MLEEKTEVKKGAPDVVGALFGVGAHLGYTRARRHASMKNFIFGSKGKTDIIDLTKSAALLDEALAFVRSLGASGKTVLFVAGKPEIRELVRETAEALNMPYVAGRWLGGTLTNFVEIKKRIQRLASLTTDRDSGVLAQKYTKKERVLLGREIAKLELNFGGLSGVERLPDALVVVDTRAEHIPVKEAKDLGIPVIGIMNSDCDLAQVSHPLVGNDASRASVQFFLTAILEAYREGTKGNVQKS
ncbi:MAG: 30S ribosomal protein S2 [Patescibacteria group bacterium]